MQDILRKSIAKDIKEYLIQQRLEVIEQNKMGWESLTENWVKRKQRKGGGSGFWNDTGSMLDNLRKGNVFDVDVTFTNGSISKISIIPTPEKVTLSNGANYDIAILLSPQNKRNFLFNVTDEELRYIQSLLVDFTDTYTMLIKAIIKTATVCAKIELGVVQVVIKNVRK